MTLSEEELKQSWKLHQEKIIEDLGDNVDPKRVKKFLEHYKERYDRFNRSFLDWRLAYTLMDDFHYCKRVGTRWFAFVGVGGSGKTTIAKNIFYYLDPKFTLIDLKLNVKEFIRGLGEADRLGEMRALFMDEPDDDIHPQTDLGRRFRKILGKARQGKYFFGICATDLTDIPPYIFRKIDVIVFTPYLGKYMFFKNRPKIKSYVVQQIRKEYQQKGYQVFFDLQADQGCLTGYTRPGTPWTPDEEKEYLVMKEDDFQSDIKDAIKIIEDKEKPRHKQTDRADKIVIKMLDDGMSNLQIEKVIGVDRREVAKIKKEHTGAVHGATAALKVLSVSMKKAKVQIE